VKHSIRTTGLKDTVTVHSKTLVSITKKQAQSDTETLVSHDDSNH
jgi:hypothetical protein